MLSKNEDLQFERIEEQLREESPTKSEINKQTLSPTKSERNKSEIEFSSQARAIQRTQNFQEDEEDFALAFPDQYHNEEHENTTVTNEVVG